MIGASYFHRGYALRSQKSKPLGNRGIISGELGTSLLGCAIFCLVDTIEFRKHYRDGGGYVLYAYAPPTDYG
jgi:hypothetical protein